MGGNELPAWGTFVIALPFLFLLAMAMFGLDVWVHSPRRRSERSRSFCEVDAEGGAMLSDPDGRLWQAGPAGPIEARIVRTGSSNRVETRLLKRRR